MPRSLFALACLLTALGAALSCRVRSVADIACANDSNCPEGSHCQGAFCAPGAPASPDAGYDPCLTLTPPEPSNGVFVAPGETGDGSQQSPLGSIGQALTKAAAEGKRRVFVAKGTYAESLSFPSSSTGISLMGGWDPSTWTRECTPGLQYDPSSTVIHSNDNFGAKLINLDAPSSLEWVKIEVDGAVATAAASSGRSAYAIRIADSRVVLRKVMAVAGQGGPGGAPAAQVRPNANAALPCGDGSSGPNGPEAPASSAPAFADTGGDGFLFEPGNGHDGQPGTNGANGLDVDGSIEQCAQCSPRFNGTNCVCDFQVAPSGPIQAKGGTCGVGGQAGGGGTAGWGGGASIALLASGASTHVTLRDVLLTSSAGGDGSSGLSGQDPLAATAPTQQTLTCQNCTGCTVGGTPPSNCTCTRVNPGQLTSTTANGPGGTGGKGGNASGGAGGWSCSIAALNGATVVDHENRSAQTSDWVQLDFSTGGAGQQGAATGTSSDFCTWP